MKHLLIFTDNKSFTPICGCVWTPLTTLSFSISLFVFVVYCPWTLAAFPTVCIATVGDSVHRTYFTTCCACEDRAGCAGEGKETQHSFEELGLLDGNNHCGRKTRLKIATDCSDIVEGYNSSTTSCFMLILGHTKVDMESRKWRLPFTAKGSFHFGLQCCINILLRKLIK